MYQHLDLMAAQSLAHERERALQTALRQRDGAAQRPAAPSAAVGAVGGWHTWVHGVLVRAHLSTATPR